MVDLDVVADHRRLADHDTGAVIDEQVVADGGAGVDVDAGLAVGRLGDDAGKQE